MNIYIYIYIHILYTHITIQSSSCFGPGRGADHALQRLPSGPLIGIDIYSMYIYIYIYIITMNNDSIIILYNDNNHTAI